MFKGNVKTLLGNEIFKIFSNKAVKHILCKNFKFKVENVFTFHIMFIVDTNTCFNYEKWRNYLFPANVGNAKTLHGYVEIPS